MFNNIMLKDFVDKLSSESATPGGGSVSALNASLAVSLCSMVFNLTINKKAFSELNQDKRSLVENSFNNSNRLRLEFLSLMNKDAEEFGNLMLSFKLPKNDEKEREMRNAKIQEGYRKSLSVPLEVGRKALEVYDIIFTAYNYGNINLLSDVGVAAMTLNSAVESAVLNVQVNLVGILDQEYKNKIAGECEMLLKESLNKKNDIVKKVYTKLAI